jgi:predicted solute-binding protein
MSEHEAMLLIGDEAIWYATRNGKQPFGTWARRGWR